MATAEDDLELYLNFYRYSTLILDYGSEALRFTLDEVCNRLNCTFQDFLNLRVHQLYHLRQPRSCCRCLSETVSVHLSVISKPQWDELYQSCGTYCVASSRTRPCVCQYSAKHTLTIQQLDITLASCILKNVAPISPDQVKDVETLRQNRNEFYAHATKSKMSATDFSRNFTSARQVIESLISRCKPRGCLVQIKADIDRLECKRMDEATVKSICVIIRDNNEHHLKLREEITAIRKLITAQDKKRSLRRMNTFEKLVWPFFAQNAEIMKTVLELKEESRTSYDRLEERLDGIERSICILSEIKDQSALQTGKYSENLYDGGTGTYETKKLDIRKTFRDGDIETIARLIERQPSELFVPDHRGRTALHFVAEGGSITSLNLILSFDLDIEAVDRRGHTVLHVSCLRGHFELTSYLLLRFPSLVTKKDKRNWNCAHYAVAGGHLKILKLLKEREYLDKCRDSFDLLIYIACEKRMRDILDYLMLEFPKKVEEHKRRVDQAQRTFRSYVTCIST